MSEPAIRPARPDEARACRDIHQAARASYRGTAEAWVAEEERLPVRPFLVCAGEGRLLIALAGEEPNGFATFSLSPPDLHLIELAVLPDWQRRGIGTALLQALDVEARDRGCRRITLTTYRHVPFNAPWFGRRGFREVTPGSRSTPLGAEMSGYPPGVGRVALARRL